ncbi:flocculation protein FLO11-like [Amphibalanus amphitrite]|uniref:flocculation protein FLO11-like n=1 Tax=Amphibalanus amphitrite TaxID=1232801 RepID=UPI001C918731|nr:flocculation protein FLO11-like [Amphibalanus amphitrite]
MRQNPVPAPESAPSVGFPADSEEIGPMSVTQFDRVAREMAAEAAPPPPRDLCDLDTEEVDQLMEEPPAPPPRETTGLERDESETAAAPADQSSQASAPGDEADTKRRSGSVGSQKRASSPLGSAVGSKRPRSQPVTPASAAKGSKEDPEVVSDDDEDLLSEGDGLQVIQDDATGTKKRSSTESKLHTLPHDAEPEDEAMEDEEPIEDVAEVVADRRSAERSGRERPAGTPGAGGGSGSTTDSPVCRAPGRRAARISDDEAEPEPPRELDEFASDAEDRVEIERLAAMPVDEFIREIQGEVCGAPVGESTRRLSEDDEDGRQDARGEKSITDSMLQQVDLPPADESICEVPADSSLAVCEDESIVEGEGRQSRPSAGRSLGDIDPDLAGAADPAPPGSQDSLAEIVASSGEVVASPGRVAHLDTVLVTPGGRRRSAAAAHLTNSAHSAQSSAHSAQQSPRPARRSGRVMSSVKMTTDTPTSTTSRTRNSGDKPTPPRAETNQTPTRSKPTPRAESKTSPRPAPTPEAELSAKDRLPTTPAQPAPESDLIPSSPVGLEGSPPRRRSGLSASSPPRRRSGLSARSPPRPPAATSPSSEDLLVPPGFFNESSMCVPAAETSVRDTSGRESDTSRGGAEQAEATRHEPAKTSPSAAAPGSAAGAAGSAAPDPSGVRRAVLPSAASAASDRTGTPTTTAAAAGGDAAEVSETESEDMFSASRPTETAAAAGRKKDSPPPPPPRPPPVMVASGLKRPEQEAAQRLAAAHGGRFLRQWQPGVTHVIVRTGPRLEAGRTLKFLQGVAARAWLVAAAWVEDSLAAGRLLPEEDYEAIDSATGEPGPRRARQTGGALFADFTFCCVGPFRDVTMEQLESLIGQSGGAVASSPAALASAPGRVRLIVAQEECDHDFSGWRRRHGLPSVSYEWLIDCVATQRLWSLLDNTLCGASEAELRQAGVPPELCLAETQETEYFDSMGL